MLAIGRGLMAGPDVLLLDEPTLGLAPIIVKEVFEKISEISQVLKTTIMVVEHNIKGILDIADRAYVLNNGRIAHDGTPPDGSRDRHLDRCVLGAGCRRGLNHLTLEVPTARFESVEIRNRLMYS